MCLLTVPIPVESFLYFFFTQVESQSISLNGRSSEQMDEELPEEEACDVSQAHSAPPHASTLFCRGPSPTPADADHRPDSSNHVLTQPLGLHNGAKHTKPETEEQTGLANTLSYDQTIKTLSKKKIKLEQTDTVAGEQMSSHVDGGVYYEDALSTLASVVCSIITDRKEDKVFGAQTIDGNSFKTEKSEALCAQPHGAHNDCQKDSDASVSNIQFLVDHRNISIDQAIAIEALTQLAAISDSTPFKKEYEGQDVPTKRTSSTNHETSKRIPVSEFVSNKVSVISSSLNQASVISSPANKQENVPHQSTPASHKLSLQELLKASSECGRSSQTPENGKFNHAPCKTERIDGAFKKIKNVDKASLRRKDEEEVAAQLLQLAFIIESQPKPIFSENSPPNAVQNQIIKYNQGISKHIKKQSKPKAAPRMSKKRTQVIKKGNRIPLAKRSSNGKTTLRVNVKKEAPQQNAKLHSKWNPFLPQTQIDLKKYLGQACNENRHRFHFSHSHKKEHLHPQALASSGYQNTHHFIADHAALSHCHGNQFQPNGHGHNLTDSHVGATPSQRHECEEILTSQVSESHSILHYGANPQAQGVVTNGHWENQSQSPGRQMKVNNLKREPLEASHNGHYKVETSGSVTILSVPNKNVENSEVNYPGEYTPTKHSLSSFLESPLRFLDTPTKNLINTPSKQISDLPSCDCMGEL